MEKNVNAIDKIISELSMKDYKAQYNKLTKDQRYNIQIGKKRFSYCLSSETIDAIEIKKQYILNNITEEDYKIFCLRYNLRK